MSGKKNSDDRRGHHRYKVLYPLHLATPEFAVQTQIKDISCAGLLCSTDRFIAPDTKLNLKMSFNLVSNRKVINREISCAARVARINPPYEIKEGDYELGITFFGLENEEKEIILKFVKQRNAKESQELHGIYVELKAMMNRLALVEQAHPTAEHFGNVIKQAIAELETVATILEQEIEELKHLE